MENYVTKFRQPRCRRRSIVLQSCLAKTMRASVVLLFAFLALAFAYPTGEVSVYNDIGGYVA